MNRKTQSRQKILNYLEHLIRRSDFHFRIVVLRVKYGIPDDGYDYESLFEKDPKLALHPPKEWIVSINTSLTLNERKYILRRIEKDINDLMTEFGVFSYGVGPDPMWLYLFYNQLYFSNQITAYSTCILEDANFESFLLHSQNKELTEYNIKVEEAKNLLLPISIRISPEASLREILDFVKKSSADIKRFQSIYKKYSKQMSKVKKKNPKVQNRNDFIFRFKDLSRKKLMWLGNYVFDGEFPDYGSVAKIISLETKRRKDI